MWGEGLSWQRWILLVPVAISFLIFLTSIFAEANRTPFDMSECETDLVGGYHTEYSSMKFAQFFMGEYAAMVVGSSLVITLFLGGWSIGFGLDGWLNEHVANWVAVLAAGRLRAQAPLLLPSSSSGCAGRCPASAMTR